MRNALPFFVFMLSIMGSVSVAQVKPIGDSIKLAATVASLLSAQENVPKPPQTIQSPNATALGAYGEIAVSPYTGKAEINIDLHSLRDGNVHIPIALQYDAAGVRPDIHPGWTGLNFSLSTHYAITRTVHDGPDEFNYPGEPLEQLGYTFTKFINNGPNWALPDTIKKTALTISKKNANDLTGIFIDTEPDEYSFNLPGLSGKFYLGSDGNWKVKCDRPVKVERITTQGIHLFTPFTPPSNIKNGNPWLNIGNYMEHFQGFIITDDDGTKYTFGGSDMAFMEYSIDFFDQGADNWICNAWYLKSITRPTGQTVNFIYERGDFVNQMYFSIYNKMSRINGGKWFACESWSSLIGQYGPYGGKLISPIYLKEINADNFKVKFLSSESTELRYTNDIYTTFENKKIQEGYSKLDFLTFLYDCYSPVPNNYPAGCGSPTLTQLLTKLKWRKLDKIQIQNAGGVTIKELEFTYNNIVSERLMLQKVQEKSGYNANKLPPYEFTYYTNGYTLPAYCQSHTDHWGFNNNKPINILNDFVAMATYGSTYRSPSADVNDARTSSLIQIKYPTGGVSKFRFEPHQYAKEVKLKRWLGEDSFAANQLAGGLRIKEVQSYDPSLSNPAVSKKYYYLANFNPASPDTSVTALSSGILGGKAQYYWPDYKPLPDDANINVEQDIFSTQSVLPASENSMGSHIGYSQVVERSSTEGWIVRKYSNFDNGHRDEAPAGFLQPSTTPYQPYNNKAFMRGKELSVETYLQNGGLASKTLQQFNVVGPLTDYSARSVKTLVTFLCTTNNYVLEGTAYLYDLRKFLPTEVTTYNYDQDNGSAVPSVATNSYWPNGQLYVSAETRSKTGTAKTWFKYPPNFADAISTAMVAKNIIAPPLEILQYTGTEAAPLPIKQTNVFYDLFSGLYLPKKVESKLPTAATFTTDIEFLTYDVRGNLLTFKEKDGPVTKLDYYGVADIGKTDQLKKRTSADGTSISQSISYNFKPLIGIETVQDLNAKTIYYEYDQFNRLRGILNGNAGGPARATFCYNYAGQVVECAALAPTGSIAASSLVLLAEPALPVTLIGFYATKQENTAVLSWSTSSESNSDHFDVERSENGKHWEKIGRVASHGESSQEQSYSLRDQNPFPGENLYRLKMVDADSTFAYSRIRNLLFDQNGQILLFPNPLTIGDKLRIQADDPSKISHIQIFDTNGKLVKHSPWLPEIDMGSLPSGLYMVQVTFSDGSISNHRVVKQ